MKLLYLDCFAGISGDMFPPSPVGRDRRARRGRGKTDGPAVRPYNGSGFDAAEGFD